MLSDRIRTIIYGIVCSFSDEDKSHGAAAKSAQDDDSNSYIKYLDKDGIDTGTYYYTE